MRTVAVAALTLIFMSPVRAQFGAPDVDARISKLVASISESRMEQRLRALVAFGTRNTLSDTSSTTRGIGAARQWILDELVRSSPKLQVSLIHISEPTRQLETSYAVLCLKKKTK